MNDALIPQPSLEDDIPSDSLLGARAPQPQNVKATGVSGHFLAQLMAKHLLNAGELELWELVRRLKLCGDTLREVVTFLRQDNYIEARGSSGGRQALRYALTERGRTFAAEAFLRNSYTGPAPVPVDDYTRVVGLQSVHERVIPRSEMQAAFVEETVSEALLDELGPALHSGRAIFLYGPSGTGKTYVARRLARMLAGPVLVPYAIAVDETVVQVYDPTVHRAIAEVDRRSDSARKDEWDRRYVLCHRPVVVSGGELTLDMLDIQYDRNTGFQQAPMQLKANNGLYLLDDLGRQQASPAALLNRWIVPLESRQDYLHAVTGLRFPVPFDVILIFSTNLRPADLADPAFLRRLGHKVRFQPLAPDQYAAIWRRVCQERGIDFDASLVQFAIRELHRPNGVPLLACHPGDLLAMALDQVRYWGGEAGVTRETLVRAWKTYSPINDPDEGPSPGRGGVDRKRGKAS